MNARPQIWSSVDILAKAMSVAFIATVCDDIEESRRSPVPSRGAIMTLGKITRNGCRTNIAGEE